MHGKMLKMSCISKCFPGVQALLKVSFDLDHGEVHALVGENGAGKSTLMKVLGGVYACDEGEIAINEQTAEILSPADALELGVSIIYQEFNLAGTLSAAENIYLGKEIRKGGQHSPRLDRKAMHAGAQEVMKRLGMSELDVTRPVQELSVAHRQLVEIGKALLNKSRILVMDEPTAVLTERETSALFEVIETLKSQGISIVYVSHRLEEVQQICDRVTVLRDGQFIITLDNRRRDLHKDEIVRYMVGRDFNDYYPKGPAVMQDNLVLEVKNLSKTGMYQDICFSLHQGEILGFSGLIGAGRTELAKSIFGDYSADSGEIWLDGLRLMAGDIRYSIRHGITLVPEDRAREGLVLNMSVADNICLPNTEKVSRNGIFIKKLKEALVNQYVQDVCIRPALPKRKAADFSGGNQQKTVIAKWLATKPRVILLDEPTRGVDVGAKAEIYSLMRELTAQGVSIIFISSEMPELLGMCDRLLVMCEGKITGEFNKGDFDQHKIMKAAAGI